MSDASQTAVPSQHQIRAELESYGLGDLLRPAGGESEELTERTGRDRYFIGMLARSSAHVTAYNWSTLSLIHNFHKSRLGVRLTVIEPDRRDFLHRFVKLNHECEAEDVKQTLQGKKGAAKRKSAIKPRKSGPGLSYTEGAL